MSHAIRINDTAKEQVDAVAEEKGISANEAADFLIGVATTRRNALARYADKTKAAGVEAAPKKKKKKATKKKAAKKATKKKAAKGKSGKGKKPKKDAAEQPEELTLN